MTLQLATAGVNALRDNHWVLNPVSGLYERSTLLELQSTNLVTRNSGFAAGVGPWVVTNQPGGAGVLTAVNDAAALAAAGLDKVVTDGIVLKLDNSAGTGISDMVIPVTTAASAASMVAWVRGGSGGVNYGGSVGVVPFGASATYQRVVSRNFTAIGGASSMRVRADAGQVVFAVLQQLEQLAIETSTIPTTSATATRSSDSAYRDLPASLVTPQAMTLYAKFIELGTAHPGLLSSSVRLFQLGNASVGAAGIAIFGAGAGGYRASHHNGTAPATTGPLAGAPSIGDQCEVMITLSTAGALSLTQSVNGAAPLVASTPDNALAGAWSDTKLWFNSFGVTLVGCNAFLSVKLARGVKSMAQMRAFP